MPDRRILTTESGAPVADNQNSQTAGPYGPVLLQDQHLVEKLARFNRERVPERVVHARGSGAYGYFEVAQDMSAYTKAKVFNGVGTRSETFVRFSTVAGGRGSPEAVRDPRGFAVKFYTTEGNYDLVGNNTPIFFIRDPLKFPDFIHSQKPDPFTNHQEPENVWDFFSHSPEATHMFTWLFGDRGIPASYRQMDGFGSHTFAWTNAQGQQFFVKYHFKTDQGIATLTSEEAAVLAGTNPESHNSDLLEAIERRDYPSWTLKVQVMPFAEAANYAINPFDLTKVWPLRRLPADRGRQARPRSQCRQLLRGRRAVRVQPGQLRPRHWSFAGQDAPGPPVRLWRRSPLSARHQHTRIAVNAPHATKTDNYGRDGAMRVDDNGSRSKNYEPNSFGGPVQTNEPHCGGLPTEGVSGTYGWDKRKTDDVEQAGTLYRLIDEAAKQRLVDNIADGLAQVNHHEIVDRSISYFRSADPGYGDRIERAIAARRA